jgi:hypothetical protein
VRVNFLGAASQLSEKVTRPSKKAGAWGLDLNMSSREGASQSGNPSRGAKNPRLTPRDPGRLRPTNRFQRFCIDQNLNLDDEGEWPFLREAELVYDQPLNQLDDAIPSFPPDFRWEEFCECWTARDRGLKLLYSNSESHVEEEIDDWGTTDTSILWLSDAVFLSAVHFQLADDGLSFDYGVYFFPFRNHSPVYVYSLSSFTVSREGFAAPPELPLHFFRHLASQTRENFLERMDLRGGYVSRFSPRLCSLFLSILPQRESNDKSEPQTAMALFAIPDESEGEAVAIDEQQLGVVVAHPFNSQTLLDLGEISEELPLERVNQLLRESQHIRHLGIEQRLANFDSSESSFSSNPRLHSLHLNQINRLGISKNLLDGVAVNMCIQDLELKFLVDRLEQGGEFLKTLEYLFQCVLPKCRSLRSLTLEFTFSYPWCEQPLLFFEKVVQSVAVSSLPPRRKLKSRFGSLVSLQVRIVTGTRVVPTETPNEILNRIVSPSLALSWCQQSRNEHSWATSPKLVVSAGLIPSMVCAINQDIIYVKTTGQSPPDIPRPYDSRSANVTIIYDLVRSFHPGFS